MILQKFLDKFRNKEELIVAKQVIAKQNEVINIQQDRLEKITGGIPMQYEVGDWKGATSDSRMNKILDFNTLRAFSENYDILRACINHKKRQISKLSWDIKPKQGYEKQFNEKIYLQTTKLFENPGGRLCKFREFVDKMVEDLIVLDAVSIWKKKDKKGNLLELVNVDGSTIRVNLGEDGELPLPPAPAYVQKVKEEVIARFTLDEMIYDFMNHRTKSPYGLSPIESLVLDIDASLKSQISNSNILGEGNVPEGFIQVPSDWKIQQMREFQTYLDDMLSGNLRMQNRIRVIPSMGNGNAYIPTKKPEDMRFMEYEKWLMMKTCSVLEVQPSELGFTDEINKATGETQIEIGESRGLKPLAMFLKSIFDDIIKYDLKYPFVEFVWTDLSKRDERLDSELAQKYIPLGVISPDEIRERMGLEPIGLKHYIQTAGGIVFVDDLINNGGNLTTQEDKKEPEKKEKTEEDSQDDTEDEIEELTKWRKKAVNTFKAGKLKDFVVEKINKEKADIIKKELEKVQSVEDIKNVFSKYIDKKRAELIFEKAIQLKRLVNCDKDERLELHR